MLANINIKFFLYISKKGQIDRLCDRVLDASENWKVSAEGYARTKKWDLYMEAYEDVLKPYAVPNEHPGM